MAKNKEQIQGAQGGVNDTAVFSVSNNIEDELDYMQIQRSEKFFAATDRWQAISQIMALFSFDERCNEYDIHMLLMQKRLHKIYPFNIYILNKAALKIQHAFFSLKKQPNRLLESTAELKETPSVGDLMSPKEVDEALIRAERALSNGRMSNNPYDEEN